MQPEPETRHYAISFDINFITPFYVLVTSILHNNKDAFNHFHVAVHGVSDQDLQQINTYVQSRQAAINFYDAECKLNGLTLPLRPNFTNSTYYRIILPGMVPAGVEKLLYLDVDTVVIGNLKELFATDLTGLVLGGVVQHNTKSRPDLGINHPQSYFNAGVLLINVPEWNRQHVFDQSLEFIRNYPEKLKWMDQDVLNGLMINKFKRLDTRYNIRYNDIPKDLPPKKFHLFLQEKMIIHYTSKHKPWRALGRNRLRFIYHKYLKMSPRAGVGKYLDLKPNALLLFHFVRIRLMEKLSNYPGLMQSVRRSKKYYFKYFLPGRHNWKTF